MSCGIKKIKHRQRMLFAFIFVSASQAQSPTDEEFVAKLNGARYILKVNRGSNVIWTRDIQGN